MGSKKREADPPPGVPGWMVTYGDMMSLLLCFFVLLVSMSNMEAEKIRQAAISLKGAFGALPFQQSVRPAPLQQTRQVQGPMERGRRSQAMARLRRIIRENKLDDVINVSENDQGIHVTIGDPALFDVGRAEIKSTVLPVLNQIVEVVNTGNEYIRVEGHTDNVPIHNMEFDDNWELSIARALSVIRYIRNRQPGFDTERLRPVGCGEFHPVADNSTEEGRAMNRRVEIYIEMAD